MKERERERESPLARKENALTPNVKGLTNFRQIKRLARFQLKFDESLRLEACRCSKELNEN
jgi:hypothetical protein